MANTITVDARKSDERFFPDRRPYWMTSDWISAATLAPTADTIGFALCNEMTIDKAVGFQILAAGTEMSVACAGGSGGVAFHFGFGTIDKSSAIVVGTSVVTAVDVDYLSILDATSAAFVGYYGAVGSQFITDLAAGQQVYVKCTATDSATTLVSCVSITPTDSGMSAGTFRTHILVAPIPAASIYENNL